MCENLGVAGPNPHVDLASIQTREQFTAALRSIRPPQLSLSQIAKQAGLTATKYFVWLAGAGLPQFGDPDFRRLLEVCGADETEIAAWERALARVRNQPGPSAALPNLNIGELVQFGLLWSGKSHLGHTVDLARHLHAGVVGALSGEAVANSVQIDGPAAVYIAGEIKETARGPALRNAGETMLLSDLYKIAAAGQAHPVAVLLDGTVPIDQIPGLEAKLRELADSYPAVATLAVLTDMSSQGRSFRLDPWLRDSTTTTLGEIATNLAIRATMLSPGIGMVTSSLDQLSQLQVPVRGRMPLPGDTVREPPDPGQSNARERPMDPIRAWRTKFWAPRWQHSIGAVSETGLDTGLHVEPETSEPGVRSVNTTIVSSDSGELIPPGADLEANTAYTLAVNIGPRHPASLLPEPDSRWPQELLPERALQLHAVLDMGSEDGPWVQELPLTDPAPPWACDCDRAGHDPRCEHAGWVRFTLTTPDFDAFDWTGVLAIYFGVVAVHVQELTLPISRSATAPSSGGVRARLIYRLTSRFDDLGPLADRVASIFVPGGSGRALVNALPFIDNPVSISVNAADTAARAARELLHDQHLTDTPRGPVANADASYSKSADQFQRDLAGLARFGWTMYNRLFDDNAVFDTMPALIRYEAAARRRAPVLNIAHTVATDPELARSSIPWSLVYDLPMPQDPAAAYKVCPSVHLFGPAGTSPPIPPHCPEPDHTGNVLCPFGFWGLSCVLEQPPRVDRMIRHVYFGSGEPAMAVAVDQKLDAQLTDSHLTELRKLLPANALQVTTVRDAPGLATVLAGNWMDVAYLYCHGGYLQHSANQRPSVGLRFGDSVICEEDIAAWRLPGGPWPTPHWADRKPVVVLNGCRTAEFTTSSLSNLVNAFVNRAGAAAVIGTEIAVEQGAASWATKQLLELVLKSNAPVGQAVRALRWQLIGRGNTLGLAYTLHGVADLRLRA